MANPKAIALRNVTTVTLIIGAKSFPGIHSRGF